MIVSEELIEKARLSGSLIDANILLLFAVGAFDRSMITRFDRLSAYTEWDYDIVSKYIAYVGKLVTSPNILTEVSNLAGKLPAKILSTFYSTLAKKIEILDESYIESKVACRDRHFVTLGLTDATIIQIALRRNCIVLTADSDLYRILWDRGARAINFNHLRQFSGEFD